MKNALFVFGLGWLLGLSARADQQIQSGPRRVDLIELYTSEGCSSCPPAERWLSGLESSPQLWKSVVPVSFHVNYWDNLGWKDRFAEKLFTERQYTYANIWKTDSVYTPCFVYNGAQWTPSNAFNGSDTSPGKLIATFASPRHLNVSFFPIPRVKTEMDVWASLTVSEIGSEVTRGENAGKKLMHDFVVRELVCTGLLNNADGSYSASLDFSENSTRQNGRQAVAIWITPHRSLQTVIQACGAWVEK